MLKDRAVLKIIACAALTLFGVVLVAQPSFADNSYGPATTIWDYTDGGGRHCGIGNSEIHTNTYAYGSNYYILSFAKLEATTNCSFSGSPPSSPPGDTSMSSHTIAASALSYLWTGVYWSLVSNVGATNHDSGQYSDFVGYGLLDGGEPSGYYYMTDGYYWIDSYTTYPSSPVRVTPWAYQY